MATNLNAIGYGRINFSNQLQMFDEQVSPNRQVLIYCYYIMRQTMGEQGYINGYFRIVQ